MSEWQALPPNMFVPLEDDEVPELIDVPHYRCKHMIDEEWEDYALLAYDCSQCPDNHGLDIECGERSHGAGFYNKPRSLDRPPARR